MSESTPTPHTHTPRYQFTELARAGRPPELCIEGEDRNTVWVSPAPAYFLVSYEDAKGQLRTRRFGLCEYYALSREVAEGLMHFWEPVGEPHYWSGVRRWALERTGRGIGKRLYAYYRRCLDEVDPTALALQRAVFAATLSAPEIVLTSKLYEEEHIVRDVIRYRAAAIALANLGLFRTQVPTRGLEVPRLNVGAGLEMMDNWRGLFSPTGEPYRSLNRTLMNLPGGVPHELVTYLRYCHLQRPILSRSELIVLTLYHKRRLLRHLPRRNEMVFQHASTERIARAVRLIAEYTGNTLSTRRTRDLSFFVSGLMDYPEEHRGNIVGLTEKSIQWHRHEQEREMQKTISELGADRPTQVPPVPLPEDPNIRFLSSVGHVCEEGLQMDNCVASYARSAVEGRCYLFHATHAGEEATVEVDQTGHVVQACGPRNNRNAASRWAERTLGRWGKTFPEEDDALLGDSPAA